MGKLNLRWHIGLADSGKGKFADLDLRNNIAAEARAMIVYERSIALCDDPGSIDALQFLMTREITRRNVFTVVLDGLGEDGFSIGHIPRTPGLMDEYFQ